VQVEIDDLSDMVSGIIVGLHVAGSGHQQITVEHAHGVVIPENEISMVQ